MRIIRVFIILALIFLWAVLQSVGDWFTSSSEKLSDYIDELVGRWY